MRARLVGVILAGLGTLDLRAQPAAPGCVLASCRSYVELNGIRPL